MKIGLIGLGKMGLNMAQRMQEKGHEIIGFSRTEKTRNIAKSKNIEVVSSIDELIKALPEKKVIWTMVPSGAATDSVLDDLHKYLSEGDVIIEGGNSYYKDSIKRSEKFKKDNIHFLDVGVSGGIWGKSEGYCLMIGGEKEVFDYLKPIFSSLTEEGGYEHVGINGAGHYVKMVHNGIEYALMQAYGEGFDLLENKKEFAFDHKKIAKLWNTGSVVRSWLLELIERAFEKDSHLENIKGYVEDSGEGRWTVQEGVETATPIPAIAISLFERFSSRQKETFSAKVSAALRNEFGGHEVKKTNNK